MPNLVKSRKLSGTIRFILQRLFMRITNLFRKRTHDTLSVEEKNLLAFEAGESLLFEDQQWIIKKIIEYNWGESLVSYDYILDNGKAIIYLGVEKNDNKLLLSIRKDISVDKIDSNLKADIIKNEVPSRILHYEGIQFLFDRESVGMSRLENTTDWTDITVWEYIDKSNKHVLTIEQYSDKEIFTSIGTVITISDITKI
jgi:hypothetical protein